MEHLIKYNAYEPETLEFWIPPAFYKDGKIVVVFERISGDFATAGSIYIYQYEYEEEATELASGPMAQESQSLNKTGIAIFPNPFRERLIINLNTTMSLPSAYSSVRIYDVTGRLIKTYNNPPDQIIWDGRDGNDRKVSPGVYFLRFENTNSEQSFCRKILKIE